MIIENKQIHKKIYHILRDYGLYKLIHNNYLINSRDFATVV